jgi:hypothetical protein
MGKSMGQYDKTPVLDMHGDANTYKIPKPPFSVYSIVLDLPPSYTTSTGRDCALETKYLLSKYPTNCNSLYQTMSVHGLRWFYTGNKVRGGDVCGLWDDAAGKAGSVRCIICQKDLTDSFC